MFAHSVAGKSDEMVRTSAQGHVRRHFAGAASESNCPSNCCCCESSSSFDSSASSISTSSLSSSTSTSCSRYSSSSSSTVSNSGTVSSSPADASHSDSCTISDHESASEHICSDDQCDHTSACKSASPRSLCSCCDDSTAVTGEHQQQQMPTAEENIADGGSYDEIGDAFELLESPCEKRDTARAITRASTASAFSPHHNCSSSICKSNWLKQSTFTLNGSRAIFYLKLLHDCPDDGLTVSSRTSDNASLTRSKSAAADAPDEHEDEDGDDEVTCNRSVLSPRCENGSSNGNKFTLWMLKKKSLARVINRSSNRKSAAFASSSMREDNKKQQSQLATRASDTKSYIKSENCNSSCISSITRTSEANKDSVTGASSKADAIKVESKHAANSVHLSTSSAQMHSSLQSATLTTQQLLEQYPDICSRAKHATSHSYQPPRPPKPLRFRPPESVAQVNSVQVNNRIEKVPIKCDESRNRESSQHQDIASTSNRNASPQDTSHSHCLPRQHHNSCESKRTNLSPESSVNGACDTQHRPLDNCNHQDTLINVLNSGNCYTSNSCCTIDLLNDRFNSNSLMVLFMTPLSAHSTAKSSENDSIDLANAHKVSTPSAVPCAMSNHSSSDSASNVIHSKTRCAPTSTIESRVPAQSALSANSASSISCKSTNSNVTRDCLAFMYPDSGSCKCCPNDDKCDKLDDANAQVPRKQLACARDALIGKLKGMFITLCHVTSDITNQLPTTCTISLDEDVASETKHPPQQHINCDTSSNRSQGEKSPRDSEHELSHEHRREQEDNSTDNHSASVNRRKLTTRKYKVAFVHEFTSILVVAIPEEIDRRVTRVTSLIVSLSQMLKFSFTSLDSAFKNRINHRIINHYLDLIRSTFLSPIKLTKCLTSYKSTAITLSNISTIMSPLLGIVQKLNYTDDEFYTEISDKLSEYETKDWTQFDQRNGHKKWHVNGAGKDERSKLNDRSSKASVDTISSGLAGDFLVVGSMLFQKGYLIQSHIPLYFQSDIVNFVTVRGLLDLTSRHSCKLVIWQEVHPTGNTKHLLQHNMSSNFIHSNAPPNADKFNASISVSNNNTHNSSAGNNSNDETFNSISYDTCDYSVHSGRFFLLAIGIKHTLFTVLLQVPFVFSTEPVITPNETIILQSIRFVISSLQRSGIIDEINDHLLLQSLAQLSHEQTIDNCFNGNAKSLTAQKLLKSAKSLKDLLSFTSPADNRSGKKSVHCESREAEAKNNLNALESSSCAKLLHTPVNSVDHRADSGKVSPSKCHPQEKSARRGVSSSKDFCLKKTQSTPTLNSKECRQSNESTDDNFSTSSRLLPSSSTSLSSQRVDKSTVQKTCSPNFSDIFLSDDSSVSRNSLLNEYRERLSSVLPENVVLFTDINVREATCHSSILFPFIDEHNRHSKLNHPSSSANECKFIHRLSYLLLDQYREAMIYLNNYLDEMPLIRECGVSFSLSPSVYRQMVNDHNSLCRNGGREKKQRDKASRAKRRAAHDTVVEYEKQSNFHGGEDKCHRHKQEATKQRRSSGPTDPPANASCSCGGDNYHEERCNNTSRTGGGVDCDKSYQSIDSTRSCNSGHKDSNKSSEDKLIHANNYDKVIYWVCAYRKSPVQTLFTCSVVPKDGANRVINSNNVANVTSLYSGNKNSGQQFTFVNNNGNINSNGKVLKITPRESAKDKYKHTHSQFPSMQSIAYSLSLADKDA